MGELVDSSEDELTTDYAILVVAQDGEGEGTLGPYAVSVPGAVSLYAGARSPNLHVRLERWTGRPDEPSGDWEDCDELPWRPRPDLSDRLLVSGFDADEEDEDSGLDIGGLGRARVQVLAQGRYRYGPDTAEFDLPPERWLLRFWPDPDGLDALAARPRRLATALGPRTGEPGSWYHAMSSWRQAGWDGNLPGPTGLRVLLKAIHGVEHAFERDELLETWAARSTAGAPRSWDASVIAPLPGGTAATAAAENGLMTALATAAGMDRAQTMADAFECLRRLGLLATLDSGRYVPHPLPAPVWETLSLSADDARALRAQTQYAAGRDLCADLAQLRRWAPGGRLVATPRRIAVRLAVTPEHVIAALHRTRLLAPGSVTPDVDDLTPDTEVTLTRPATP